MAKTDSPHGHDGHDATHKAVPVVPVAVPVPQGQQQPVSVPSEKGKVNAVQSEYDKPPEQHPPAPPDPPILVERRQDFSQVVDPNAPPTVIEVSGYSDEKPAKALNAESKTAANKPDTHGAKQPLDKTQAPQHQPKK
jgi:alkylated DNA repair dioxygenase AlkB